MTMSPKQARQFIFRQLALVFCGLSIAWGAAVGNWCGAFASASIMCFILGSAGD